MRPWHANVTGGLHQPEIQLFYQTSFAAGMGGHGVGAARAFQVSPVAGTFAGIAIGLSGAFTSILLPLLFPWLAGH